jgi:hypothetical protein
VVGDRHQGGELAQIHVPECYRRERWGISLAPRWKDAR